MDTKRESGLRWNEFLATFAMMVVAYSLAPAAPAQSVEAYEYARTGRPTMTLYVWGDVSRPGIWRVERDLDPIEFLTLLNVQTGGTEQEVREKRYLKIYRHEGISAATHGPDIDRILAFEAELEEVFTGTSDLEFRDGDVLTLEVETSRKFFTLQNVSSLIGTAATLVLLIFRLGEL